jgi:DNA topoisomerase-3
MSKSLIIAEKPSVAQDIVRALTPVAGKFDKHDDHFENDRYVVTSAVGHLVEIKAPDDYDVKRGKWSFANLPVMPPHFDLKPIDKTKARLNAVVKLVKRKDVTELINACDAGREGELIFRLIVQYAGGAKGPIDKPVQRLWLQSMTPQAIRDGFEKLRSNEQMLGLADAARSRSEADWLVGINGTRAMTAFNSRDGGFFLTTVGRVQTPTLSIVVEREEKIRKHVPRDYWEMQGRVRRPGRRVRGQVVRPGFKKDPTTPTRADRLWNEAEAKAIAEAVRAAAAPSEAKPSSQLPGLYDLTTLQREANSRFGFSAKTTLSLAQALYEKHKVLTYPRTDSRHLPEDYLAWSSRPSACWPRRTCPARCSTWPRMRARAWRRATSSPASASSTTPRCRTTSPSSRRCRPQEPDRGRGQALRPGGQALHRCSSPGRVPGHHPHHQGAGGEAPRTSSRPTARCWSTGLAGRLRQGSPGRGRQPGAGAAGRGVRTESVDAGRAATKPPARYTEATLLSAMEGAGKLIDDDELREAMAEKGLGTPATRAAIIEGLITEKYMLREGRELMPTAKAFQLMTLLRGLGVEDLTKPELTGNWEYQLAEMEQGKLSREPSCRRSRPWPSASSRRPRNTTATPSRATTPRCRRPARTAAAW